MTLTEKIFVGLIGSALVGGMLIAAEMGSNRARRVERARKETSSLVLECMKKAAGTDKILDNSEGMTLARALGYQDAFLENEQIILDAPYILGSDGKKSYLLVGYNPACKNSRTSMPVSQEEMRKYLGLTNSPTLVEGAQQ